MDAHGRVEAIKLLDSAQVAEAAGELLDVQQVAQQQITSEGVIRERVKRLENMGLLLGGLEENEPPIVLTAGKQFLARGGEVSREVLNFMAQTVEDLNARQALLTGGTVLVDEYRHHIYRGTRSFANSTPFPR